MAVAAELAQLGNPDSLPPRSLADLRFDLFASAPGAATVGPDGPISIPAPSPTTVLDTLAALTVEPVDESALPGLLAQSVEAAVYWQEPDAVDLFLRHPEIPARLEPWARELAVTPAAEWWSDPFDDSQQQFVVTWQGAARPSRPAREVLAEWRAGELSGEARARRELPEHPGAPFSGTWWSAPVMLPETTRLWPTVPGLLADPATETWPGLPLGIFLTEDSFCPPTEGTWRAVALPPTPRVLDLTEHVWVDLCREYPVDVSASRRHDWYRATGRCGDWVIPDWLAVADDWDAVHLPITSYLALAGRPLRVDDSRSTVLAGWSPGATYWLVDLP